MVNGKACNIRHLIIGCGWAIALTLVLAEASWARPQYATRHRINNCMACHYQPTGGGPKNPDGKRYQSRWLKINPLLIQDYVSADFRTLFYRPEKQKTAAGGSGVMAGSVAGHASLDDKQQVHLVIEHNVAGFSSGQLRDTYAQYRLGNFGQAKNLDTIMAGRFRVPFGMVSDEHRTYTDIQSGSQWFTFETGMMFSGNPSYKLHWDFAAINGLNNTGQSLRDGGSELWGSVINLRWMPSFFFVGASGRLNDTEEDYPSYALALYTQISVDGITQGRLPLALSIEGVRARGFNSNLARGYVSSNTYAQSLERSTSEGLLTRIEYTLNPYWVLVYKFDRLLPDQDYPSDYYERHGFGFRWHFAPASQIIFRNEWATATHPSESAKTGTLAQDATFLILEVSI
tara:strand:+ start:3960 stop:5162 length:1203 start_codon:yes stop_codon:yes gene_type:complete